MLRDIIECTVDGKTGKIFPLENSLMTAHGCCYVAGLGFISSIGANVDMNYASFQAGISGYRLSDYRNRELNAIQLAQVPEDALGDLSSKLALNNLNSPRFARIILTAEIALRELLDNSGDLLKQPIPMIQACPDSYREEDELVSSRLISHITRQAGLEDIIDEKNCRSVRTGRPGVIDAIELAFRYLQTGDFDLLLVGGSDSCDDPELLKQLDAQERLGSGVADGFTPGDGAGYILLTPHKNLAMTRDGKRITLSEPVAALEPGHLFSNEPYLGDGLASSFSQLFSLYPEACVDKIYSSMNGERHWAKEYGIASVRNCRFISDRCELEHPADCYGDLGATTGAAMIALAACELWNHSENLTALIYCSADRGRCSSLLMNVEH